jgi:hypothetical protein
MTSGVGRSARGKRKSAAERRLGRGTAHAGEERKEGREMGLGWPMRERGERGERDAGLGQGCWIGLPTFVLFPFLLLFF